MNFKVWPADLLHLSDTKQNFRFLRFAAASKRANSKPPWYLPRIYLMNVSRSTLRILHWMLPNLHQRSYGHGSLKSPLCSSLFASSARCKVALNSRRCPERNISPLPIHKCIRSQLTQLKKNLLQRAVRSFPQEMPPPSLRFYIYNCNLGPFYRLLLSH